MNEVLIIEIPSEIGAGTRGASLGSQAIRIAANRIENRYFQSYPSKQLKDRNDSLFHNTPFRYGKRIKELYEVCENLATEISTISKEGKQFPLVIAGDHSTAAGTISGLKMAHPEKRIGVIWVDAHADIHTPYTTPSGNLHGMPLTIALNIDHKKARLNEPKEETLEYWDKLKNIGGIAPKINPEDIVYLGVRDTEWPEDDLMDFYRMNNYTIEQIRNIGARKAGKQALKDLEDCDLIYVSYDVDVLDSSLSKGTGTPVPNGLWLNEVEDILVEVLKSPKVACFEMVEVNPCLDNKGNLMAEMAFQVLKKCTHRIEITHGMQQLGL
jgi:arginase